jgi:TPR repeat protein
MSPSDDDDDRHIMPGPPWVRRMRASDDSYPLEEDDAPEPRRQDASFGPTPNRARTQRRDFEDRYEQPQSSSYGRDSRYQDSGLPTLEPVVMPPPPVESMRLPALGIIVKLGGAVFVAACAALAMMNAVQSPATGVAASAESGSQSAAGPVFGGLTEIASAQAKALAVPEPQQMADAFVAPTAPSNVGAASQSSLGVSRTGPRESFAREITPREASPREPSAREIYSREASLGSAPARQMPERGASPGDGAARPDTPPRAAAPAEERRTGTTMTSDEMSSLLKRGRALVAAGDLASARLILTRLAEAGSVDACVVLASTYDAAVLADMHVVGVQPDAAKARAWYLKAAEQGSPEARRRLQQSSSFR